MDHTTLIATISEIVENQNIEKKGLSLTYTLDTAQHKDLQEYFFRVNNPYANEVPYSKIFEVEIAGLVVKFVEK